MKNNKLTALLSSAVLALGVVTAPAAYAFYGGMYREYYIEGGIWTFGDETDIHGEVTKIWSNYYHGRERHSSRACVGYLYLEFPNCFRDEQPGGKPSKAELEPRQKNTGSNLHYYKVCYGDRC